MKTKNDNPLPKIAGGAVCVQWKKCGKSNCKCVRGALHGPYYAHFVRRNGKLIKRYVRLSQAEQATVQCQTTRTQRAVERTALAASQTLLRRFRSLLRQYS